MKTTEGEATLEVAVVIRDACWMQGGDALEDICRQAALTAYDATRENAEAGLSCEACIVLADDDFVAGLNRQYRECNGPTNVLSFASDPPKDLPHGMPVLLGDVIIARGIVVREATEMKISVINHLRHLVVHGMLHLLGYDHVEQDDADKMESQETRILAMIGVDDPYASV